MAVPGLPAGSSFQNKTASSARGRSTATFNVKDVGNLTFGKKNDYTTPAVLAAAIIGAAMMFKGKK